MKSVRFRTVLISLHHSVTYINQLICKYRSLEILFSPQLYLEPEVNKKESGSELLYDIGIVFGYKSTSDFYVVLGPGTAMNNQHKVYLD